MSRYSSSAQFSHDQPERTGVLLVQLGTPEAAEAGPVRRYLKQFLSDPRVVEIPPALWWPILNGIILRTRPAQSARKYASIWTDAGSPLLVNTQAQAKLTQGYLGNDGFDVKLAFAMRYGEPSISSQLEALREQNVTRLLVVPMYPQFAGSTTASVFDETTRVLSTWRNLPEVRFTRGFHTFQPYIDALASHIRKSWGNDGPPDKLLMSFHGVPRQTLLAGDPYHCECHATARLLGAALGLPDDRWQLSFQSRFGKARWLEPYTEATLRKLGAAGTGRIDVVCPGFVVDCLETLEEIAIEGRDTFKEAGGGQFNYIACLNDSPDFIAALARLIGEHLGGWPVTAATGGPAAREAAAQARQARALAMGAERQA
mgnify:CR=1 FL=1